MNTRTFITTCAFAVAAIAAIFVVFSTADAEARGGGRGFSGTVRDHRMVSPPPLASKNTVVRPANVVSGCSIGRRCATTSANGGVVVTTSGGRGPRFPRR